MKKYLYYIGLFIGVILIFADLPVKSYPGEIAILFALKCVGLFLFYLFYKNVFAPWDKKLNDRLKDEENIISE